MQSTKQIDTKWSKSGLIRKLGYMVNIFLAMVVYIFKKPEVCEGKCWIFGLADDIYANNGRVFYEYMRERHPYIKIFWICDKNSVNILSKDISSNTLIIRSSVKNYLYALGSEVAVYGFSDRDVAPGFFRIYKHHKSLLVNISHGFDGLKGMPQNYYTPLPADIICAASTYEMNMKINHCGADPQKVKLTGFARYDKWDVNSEHKHSGINIFIMPTWRDWYEEEMIDWKNTSMYQSYIPVLKYLNDLETEYSLNIKYNFHPRMRMFFSKAEWNQFEKIKPIQNNETIQELLRWADIVITDYSSIFWDSIYMKKRTLLYWFDENEYSQKRGLMVDHNFYNLIFNTSDSLLKQIEKEVSNISHSSSFLNSYFDWTDKNNCERIFSEIEQALMQIHQKY